MSVCIIFVAQTSVAGTGATAAKEVAAHRDRERRARLGLDTAARSKEHALQMEIAQLKKKLAAEQQQKQVGGVRQGCPRPLETLPMQMCYLQTLLRLV